MVGSVTTMPEHTSPDPDHRRRLERELADEHRGFRYHLAAYLIANLVFLAWDLFYVPEATWAHWPIIGWGAGLLSHYLGGPRCAAKRLESAATGQAR